MNSFISQFTRLISTVEGKDKVFKASQYGSRFLWYYLSSFAEGPTTPAITPYHTTPSAALSYPSTHTSTLPSLPTLQQVNVALHSVNRETVSQTVNSVLDLAGHPSATLQALGQSVAQVTHLPKDLTHLPPPSTTTISQLKKLDAMMADVRKPFRLFRFLEQIQKGAAAFQTESSAGLAFLALLRSLSYAAYFFFDPLAWMVKHGILMAGPDSQIKMKKYARLGYLSWFWGVFFAICYDIFLWRRLSAEQRALRRSTHVTEEQRAKIEIIHKKKRNIILNHVKNGCDLEIASALSEFHNMHTPGVLGLAGFVSAIIAIYQQLNP